MIVSTARSSAAVALRVTLTAVALLLALAASADAKPRVPRVKPAASAPVPRPVAPPASVAPEPVLNLWIDPDTQEMTLEPGPGRVPLALGLAQLNALDTSMDGLTRVTRGTFTSVDLRGRFRPVWVLVVDGAGAARPLCLTSLPPAVAAAAQQLRKEAGHDR